jgi:hypothetical protein
MHHYPLDLPSGCCPADFPTSIIVHASEMHVQTITIDPLSLTITGKEYGFERLSLCTKFWFRFFHNICFRHFLFTFSVQNKIERIKPNEADIKLSGLYIYWRSIRDGIGF